MYQRERVRLQGKIVFVLPRKVCRLRSAMRLPRNSLHNMKARVLWQDECRSLLDRYDSDVSEFQSEQKMAVAEKLQMNIVEHDSARTSARISALEREFSELKSRSAVFWKMSWVQPARDFDFCNPQPDQTCGTDLS